MFTSRLELTASSPLNSLERTPQITFHQKEQENLCKSDSRTRSNVKGSKFNAAVDGFLSHFVTTSLHSSTFLCIESMSQEMMMLL